MSTIVAKAAEVLNEHVLWGYGRCGCGVEFYRRGKYSADHRAHVAQALAGAGVLANPDALRDLEEIDRNARAYGWSVGRGHPLAEQIHDVDPENPFLDPNWRDRTTGSES